MVLTVIEIETLDNSVMILSPIGTVAAGTPRAPVGIHGAPHPGSSSNISLHERMSVLPTKAPIDVAERVVPHTPKAEKKRHMRKRWEIIFPADRKISSSRNLGIVPSQRGYPGWATAQRCFDHTRGQP